MLDPIGPLKVVVCRITFSNRLFSRASQQQHGNFNSWVKRIEEYSVDDNVRHCVFQHDSPFMVSSCAINQTEVTEDTTRGPNCNRSPSIDVDMVSSFPWRPCDEKLRKAFSVLPLLSFTLFLFFYLLSGFSSFLSCNLRTTFTLSRKYNQ